MADMDASAGAGGTVAVAATPNTTAAGRVAPAPPSASVRKLLQGRPGGSSLGQQQYEAVELNAMAYVTNNSVFESLVRGHLYLSLHIIDTSTGRHSSVQLQPVSQLHSGVLGAKPRPPCLSVASACAGREATVGTAAGPGAIGINLWLPGAGSTAGCPEGPEGTLSVWRQW